MFSFQIKLEIQEFYESILLDEQSDRVAKINATLQFAEEWDRRPLLKRDTGVANLLYLFFNI